jgi:hypothetical protein
MNKQLLISITLILTFAFNSYSQDTINLINGKQLVAKSIYEEPNSSLLKYDYTFHGKEKQTSIDVLSIYSINYANHTEKIFYMQDSAMGFTLSVQQMKLDILGERSAYKYYKAPWVTVGGFVVGATATYFLQFWGVISPAVYATAFGIITPKVHTDPNLSYSITSNYYFLEGYQYTATRKKVKNALLGGIAGVAAMSLVYTFAFIVDK